MTDMRVIGLGILLVLAACQPPADEAPANASSALSAPEAAPAPAANAIMAPPPAAPSGDLAAWMQGSWSYDATCASDMIIHYNADGSLDNAGDTGSWSIAGDTVTETIREGYDPATAGSKRFDPPQHRSYTIARKDAGHGVITIQGRTVAIQRC